MIRFIIAVIVVVIEFILAVPLGLIALLIGLFSKKAKDKWVRGFIVSYFAVIDFISGAKVTYKGIENIPKEGAVLYVANHQSFFDVLLITTKLPYVTGYVAKKSFEKVPIFAQCMKLTHSLFLDREDIKQGLKVILQAIELVKSGISVFIFPEGTRSKTGKMADFKEGSMKVAVKGGCPVIPIAISNTSAIFEDHFPKLYPAKVIIEFLPQVDPESFDKDEKKHLGKYCHDMIETAKEKNDAQLEVLVS